MSIYSFLVELYKCYKIQYCSVCMKAFGGYCGWCGKPQECRLNETCGVSVAVSSCPNPVIDTVCLFCTLYIRVRLKQKSTRD